jgi:hypothetical protein
VADRPPPIPGIFDWRRQVLQMVIFVGFIAALGYAASQGSFDYMSNEVTLTVEPNRTLVDFASSEPPVIQLHVKLKNNTSKLVELEAQSPCKILQWVVLTDAQEFVQARTGKETECPDQPTRQTLSPGQQFEEYYALILTPARFDKEGKYQAHVRYWGYRTQIDFSVKPKKP